MIPDFEHNQNRKWADEFRAMGYEFEITADKYFVKFKQQGVGGGSVMLPRSKPLHWRHREPNLRDNLKSAVMLANRHATEQGILTGGDHAVNGS